LPSVRLRADEPAGIQPPHGRIAANRGYPGLLRRLGAVLYDSLILGGVWFAATACLLPLNGGEAIAPGQWLFPVYLVLVSYLFFGWFWTHGGQTIGMRAWKIRVVSCSGKALTWRQALIRFGCAILSWSAAGVGYWWIAFSDDRNGWHDLVSGSRIVWMDSYR
jgi:uncharacterized RDD family membrane protein YckC